MFTFILVIHTVLCIGLVGLVLLQQGKGADMGAAFGGGSNTLFGAGGAADFITKLTTGMAISFMITSVLLVRAYNSQTFERATRVDDPLSGSVVGVEEPAVEVTVAAVDSAKSDESAAAAPAQASVEAVAPVKSDDKAVGAASPVSAEGAAAPAPQVSVAPSQN